MEKLGVWLIAGALLLLALRIHGADPTGADAATKARRLKATKGAGSFLACLAGAAALVAAAGHWMVDLAGALGVGAGALVIVCAAILIADWVIDGKPDRPAFWAAFLMPFALLLGASQLPAAMEQIRDGLVTVQEQEIPKETPR